MRKLGKFWKFSEVTSKPKVTVEMKRAQKKSWEVMEFEEYKFCSANSKCPFEQHFNDFSLKQGNVFRSGWKVVGACTFIVWLKEKCITTWSRLKLTIRFEIWLFSLFVSSVLACCFADNIILGLLGTLL